MGIRNKIFFMAALFTAFAAGLAVHYLNGGEVARLLASPGVADFHLLDQAGRSHLMSRYSDAPAIVIIGHGLGCPIVQKLTGTLNQLQREFAPRGVQFFMLNVNTQDERREIISEADGFGLELPVLLDPSQTIGRELGLTRTAEAVVLDGKSRRVLYRGAVDDQMDYGVNKQNASNRHLHQALSEILAGTAVTTAATEPRGCAISYEAPKPEYERHITRIMRHRCLRCHGDGKAFPPFFTDYDEIRGWRAMIRETILTERMPPYSADHLYGQYENDQALTAEEKRLFIAWLEQDLPRRDGGEFDPILEFGPPPLPQSIKGRRPLYTAAMAEPAAIPPDGEVEYRYFQLGGPAPFDMWVDTINVVSTNLRQLHHSSLMVLPQPLAFYEKESQSKRDEEMVRANKDGDIPIYLLWTMLNLDGYKDANYARVQVYGLGAPVPKVFRRHSALFIPKGYHLVLESHYMGTGRQDSERTTLEFFGTRERPAGRRQLKSLTVAKRELDIPPHAKRHVESSPPYTVDKTMDIVSFLGHLHMRGRAVRMTAEKNGVERTIVSIPNFYYGWQTGAGLNPVTPVRIEAGSRLVTHCEYDNSAQNPNNPDPSKRVHFGQTHDRTEMCKMNLTYLEAD